MPDTISPLAANLEEVRISELPEATQANATDLLEASQVEGAQYVSRKLALNMVTALIASSSQIQDAIDAAIAAIPPPPPNDWDSIPGKPTTFPPAAHIHPESDITNLVADLALKAPIANPTFTGDPKAPTPATADNDTSVATTAYVKANLAALPAPPTTLPPNGAAGGDLAGSYPNPTIKASVALTGNPTAPTPTVGDNDTSIATTAFVTAALAAGASISVGTAPPGSPAANQLWWNTNAAVGGGQLYIYYNDGNTTQWVPASPGAATPTSPGGDVFALYVGADFGTTGSFVTVACNTIKTGNSGGWYNTSNGRFTPPAGRYHISASCGIYTGGVAIIGTFILRKNGTDIYGGGATPPAQTSPGANQWGQLDIAVVVDANGTDFFDVQINTSSAGAANRCSFSAFPISGVKGPPGDIGAPVANFNIRITTNNVLSGPNALNLFRPLATPVKDYDPDNVWDLANGWFTAPSNGRYQFDCHAFYTQSALGFGGLTIRHVNNANTVTIKEFGTGQTADTNSYGTHQHNSQEFQMAAGERVLFIQSCTNATTCTALATGSVGGGLANAYLTYACGRKVV